MLAHGTGGCQWLAVIVFFFLGGVWIHDPIVHDSMTSCEGCGTKVMAAVNLRLKKIFCALDFMVQTTAPEAQEYDSGVYQAGFEWLGPINASSEVVVWTNMLVGQNSRLEENFYAYDFSGSISTPGAQEYDSLVFPVEQDHPSMLNSSVGVEFDDFDLLDQWDYVGQLVIGFERPGQQFKGQGCLRRAPWVQDFHVLLLCFLSNILYAKWKAKNALRLVCKSSNWVAMGGAPRREYLQYFSTSFLFWFILLGLCTPALGVTCKSCFDGIEGCAGGAACLFATRTAENLAALTVVGGAAINVVSLLPSSYVRHLPTQVLRTLAAIARVPAIDGPPDLGAMNLTELQECLASGRIELTAYRNELSARLADGATVAAQVTRISAMLLALQNNTLTSSMRTIDGINSFGVLGYLVAAASLIVNSGKRTYSSGTTSSSGSSSASNGGTSLSIRTPTSGSQFSELLMVWQTLAHAIGAANILATAPFLQQIVWDGISTLGLLWEQAYCLFIIYLEAIEDSRGTLHLANVFAAGAQDTRLKAANKRYSEIFCQPCDDQEENDKGRDKGSKKWNGKDSPNANGVCKTYNFKDAEHPKQHLHKDGTCKFRHVCNQWVTGKGAGGMCELDHTKWACTNPNKTNVKPTQ